MDAVIAFLNAAGTTLAAITAVTPEVENLVTQAATVLSTGQPTDAQWDALHAVQAQNTAALDAPMEGE